MENWLLIAVGIIFLISVIWGVTQGLLRITVSLVATIITVIVVVMLTPKVSQFVEERTSIGGTIGRVVSEMITPEEEVVDHASEEGTADGGSEEGDADSAPEEEGADSGAGLAGQDSAESQTGTGESAKAEPSRQEQIQAIEGSKFPAFMQNAILENNNSDSYEKLGAESFYDYVGMYVAQIIINIVSFLMVYAVLRVFVRILMNMIDLISELPVLHGLNRLAGGVLGLGVGVIAVWLFFLVITLIYATSFGQDCFRQIEGNQILSILYEKNYILHFLSLIK